MQSLKGEGFILQKKSQVMNVNESFEAIHGAVNYAA